MELPVSGVAMHGAALAKVGGIHQARHGRCDCSCVASLRCKKKARGRQSGCSAIRLCLYQCLGGQASTFKLWNFRFRLLWYWLPNGESRCQSLHVELGVTWLKLAKSQCWLKVGPIRPKVG